MVYGVYDQFPPLIHSKAQITHSQPRGKVQKALLRALRRLNGWEGLVLLNSEGREAPYTVGFEVGVAEGVYFNFLDEEEASRLEKIAKARPLNPLDLFLRVEYHTKPPQGLRATLRSDQYFLRLSLPDEKTLEISLHHVKGTRRVSAEDLTHKLVEEINRHLRGDPSKRLKLTSILKG